MKQKITKWYKKNATVVNITTIIGLTVSYTTFVRGIQQDLDEVRYSREINKIEKEHAVEIDSYKQKIYQLREENMNLRNTQLDLMEDYFDRNIKQAIRKEVNYEDK